MPALDDISPRLYALEPVREEEMSSFRGLRNNIALIVYASIETILSREQLDRRGSVLQAIAGL